MATTQERIEKAAGILDQTLGRAEKEAATYESRAARERLLHTSFSAVLAVLAVAAPALVTYQTQVKNETIALVAVLVVAIAGAGTALQSTFRWGDRFRRTRLTALELSELVSSTKLQKHDVLDSTDEIKTFQKVYELNQAVAKQLQTTLRRHIEAEVALVTQPLESPAALPRPDAQPGAAADRPAAGGR